MLHSDASGRKMRGVGESRPMWRTTEVAYGYEDQKGAMKRKIDRAMLVVNSTMKSQMMFRTDQTCCTVVY
jgi:hypothetical protein